MDMDEDFISFDEIGEAIEFMPDEMLPSGFLPSEEKLPINIEDIDDAKIDKLLTAVRVQYTQLEEENSRLMQLSSLIKEKINACIQRDIESSLKTEPRSLQLNLDLKPDLATQEEEEEEDEEEDKESS